MHRALLPAALLCLAACMGPATPTQRLSETAYDYNTALRFGRIDVAADLVAVAGREGFAKQHAGWGRTVRIVEVELVSLMLRDKDDAKVVIAVSWQRDNEADVRTTQVAQDWHDDRGWRVISEARTAGDKGLFGEGSEAVAPQNTASAQPGRFQTRVIRSE